MIDIADYPEGYTGFRMRLYSVADDIAGDCQDVRRALHHIFEEALKNQIAARTKMSRWDVEWTMANSDDFHFASMGLEHQLTHKGQKQILATAPFKAGRLVLLDDAVYLEGSIYRVAIARVLNHPGYDSRARANVDKWSAYLTDDGKRCISRYTVSGPSATNAKTEKAAALSLRKLVEKFCKVKFADVKEPA